MNNFIKVLCLSSLAFHSNNLYVRAMSPEDISRDIRGALQNKNEFNPSSINDAVTHGKTTWAESFIRFAIELCLQSLNKNPSEQKIALESGNNIFAGMIGESSQTLNKNNKIKEEELTEDQKTFVKAFRLFPGRGMSGWYGSEFETFFGISQEEYYHRNNCGYYNHDIIMLGIQNEIIPFKDIYEMFLEEFDNYRCLDACRFMFEGKNKREVKLFSDESIVKIANNETNPDLAQTAREESRVNRTWLIPFVPIEQDGDNSWRAASSLENIMATDYISGIANLKCICHLKEGKNYQEEMKNAFNEFKKSSKYSEEIKNSIKKQLERTELLEITP